MKRLVTWPFAGPRLHADEGGRPSLWVMADPARGPALGFAVAVRRDGGLLVPDASQGLATVPVEADRWSSVPLPASVPPGSAVACLLLYDWPAPWAQASGAPELSPAWVQDELARLAAGLRRQDWPVVDAEAIAGTAALRSLQGPLTFAVASCQFPATPLNEQQAHASLERLARRSEDAHQPRLQFTLFMGDQIYADASGGLMDPAHLHERYARKYENYLRIPGLRRLMRRSPTFMMLDDHEVAIDCEPPYEGEAGRYRDEGLAAYWTYQRMAPPRPQLWFTPCDGPDAALFVLDTRMAREPRTVATHRTASMLGAAQMQAFKQWLLARPAASLKLVGSASMFLPRHVQNADCTLRLDGWDGYPGSLHEVLAFVCDHQIQNVVFLCGDEHLSCVASVEVRSGARAARLLSVESSALYAPFAFANGRSSNLVLDEEFGFEHGGRRYACRVHTDLVGAGDGYFDLQCRPGAAWEIDCRFSGALGTWRQSYALAPTLDLHDLGEPAL